LLGGHGRKDLMQIQFALAYRPAHGGGLGWTPDITDKMCIDEAMEWIEMLRAQWHRERKALREKG
jgi:hypothetical protein